MENYHFMPSHCMAEEGIEAEKNLPEAGCTVCSIYKKRESQIYIQQIVVKKKKKFLKCCCCTLCM